ncbi:MAG: hypothetical protein KGL39_44480 [Patescibacteria group bacterium]|nr:hypothetical protein [Patescibacteria group bacterium]
MTSLMEAISPTALALLSNGDVRFFQCAYAWQDPQFGELTGFTVILGADAEAALKHFRSVHPHLTDARILDPQPEPESDFVRRRSFLKKQYEH